MNAFGQTFLCVLAVVCSSLIVENFQGDQLPPPRPTLVAVHWPDLSQLESDVRNQITTQKNSLVAAVKNPAVSDEHLSAAYGAMGEVFHAYSLLAPARECYLNASQLSPQNSRWIYLLAKLDQTEGRVDDAIRRFRIVASLNPRLIAVPVNLGNIYLELNSLDEAERSFLAALKIESENPAAHYGLGQIALSRRHYSDAVTHFEKALALAPGANRIHYALGMAYRGLQDPEKAKLHLAQQGPVGVRVADPITESLRELVQSARVYIVRGKQAFEAKRYREAAAEFRKAIAADPESVPAHVNLGATLSQLGDPKGAVDEFEKALLIDPNNTNANYNLAVLLAAAKDHERAIAHLRTLPPTDDVARFLLAQELLQIGQVEEALKLAQSVFAATGAMQHGAFVGVVLSQLDRCNEAAEWQRRLIAAAVQQRNAEWETRLKIDLQRYEKGPPCRTTLH